MTAVRKPFWTFLLLACVVWPPARAQNVQFLPEIDAHLKLNSAFRGYLQAKDDREGGDPTQATIGPSLQLYLKPLIKLKKIKSFDLDDAKSRFLVLESGYRYITAPDAPSENRMLVAVTSNFPLNAGFSLSDRNRADLDWKSGIFTWRCRNKLTLDRTVAIHSYHTPKNKTDRAVQPRVNTIKAVITAPAVTAAEATVGVAAGVEVGVEAGTDSSLIMSNDPRWRGPRRRGPIIHTDWPLEPPEVHNFRISLTNSTRRAFLRQASRREEDPV